jgi:hypothetical protein
VQGRSHERRAHDLARPQRLDELLGPEALDPRPQPDERVLGLLRLHPGQPLHGLDRAHVGSLEQQLARERGATQLAARQRGSSCSFARRSI